MDFTTERNQLTETVSSIASGLPARPLHPIHAGILVSAADGLAQFTASDGQVVMNAMTEAEVAREGTLVFPRVFAEIAKTLPAGQVRISSENFMVSLACGKAHFTFPVQRGEDYPFPSLELPCIGEADGPEFRMALRKVLPALDQHNATIAMTAVQMKLNYGDIRFVAADHYMIAVADCDMDLADCDLGDDDDRLILIPGKAAERIARTDGAILAICMDKNRIQVRSGGLSITSTTLDEKFPAWEKAMSGEGEWTELPEGVRDAVKRAALTLGEKEAVVVDFDPDRYCNELIISTDGAKGGFLEHFQVEYEADPVIVRIGHQLLLQALNWCNEVCVRDGKPLLLRGNGVRYLVQVRRGA